ncbi:uncharacterized protein LOC127258989 [Andrographis paniculata]|uniref:uncharacterized protein LOC127258989 n=1 Tax=Andrographis paniculata TaxID=175694 RepID=UPI0021E866F5|nr:uncharacterized protein LOC127258989 [Andrographis paniculata]
MDSDGDESAFLPSALVSLTSMVSPSLRRLSSCFTPPKKPTVRAKPQLAWVSLQGRLIGAEEATAVSSIDANGVLSTEAAAAWELFTPIQRVLIVAVVAAAAANSKKNKQIFQLQKSVEVRDQVLLEMQQKLDTICDQLNHSRDQPEAVLPNFEHDCKPGVNHHLQTNDFMATKGSNYDECLKYKTPSIANEAEPEERRMSDLSDWAPSIASSIDIQMDNSVNEHEYNALIKENLDKDVAIKTLSSYIQSSDALASKRIVELEDLIRRKNMIINKLRKDAIILEQKVMNLMRLRRKSFMASSSKSPHVPMLTDNVLFDMDSTTGPSSSDSDDSSNRRQALSSNRMIEEGLINGLDLSRVTSSTSMDRNRSSTTGSRTSRATTMLGGRESWSERRFLEKSKEVVVHKRWV